MHYSRAAFSPNGENTIDVKPEPFKEYQKEFPNFSLTDMDEYEKPVSYYDVVDLNKVYG